MAEDAPSARLWGMLVCHCVAPRTAGPAVRTVAGQIARVVSLLLRSLADAQQHVERLARNAMLRAVVDRLAGTYASHRGVAPAEADLLRLVGATAALVTQSGRTLRFGQEPSLAVGERILASLRARAAGDVLAVDNLGGQFPELAPHARECSGALLAPYGPLGEDAVVWFRPEFSRTITWGGNPDEPATVDPLDGQLHPRTSFAAWLETVKGRSAPWTDVDKATARDLCRLVDAAMAERNRTELARLRHYDPLTNLPNRVLLEERLNALAARPGAAFALLFLDLDGFKAVNDTLGHQAGDALLIEVARRLSVIAGESNLAARLGGDEFVVLGPDLDRGGASAMGERIRQSIKQPIEVGDRPCHVSSSIGIAVAQESGSLDLVRAADMAMYAAKRGGGNRVVLFELALFERAALHFELEHDMRHALRADDQFALLYQPIFVVAGGAKRLGGFEALVRWRHPRHGWMSPAAFIPMAEKSGLIQPLGDWVLATGLRQGRTLRLSHPRADLTININVSALQLARPGYCESVAHALQVADFPAAALCLEVTESMLTDATGSMVLADLRGLGVSVAIDDFGIGFSSLSYLRRLPVDKVKLDRSFLEDIEGDTRGVGFVNAVIALAHAAGKPVVFEGIETRAQSDIAIATGADMLQGYMFAPPLSMRAAEDLTAQYRDLDRQAAEGSARQTDDGH
jgi:diguanylate cyclase (GGDEF)-like protein